MITPAQTTIVEIIATCLQGVTAMAAAPASHMEQNSPMNLSLPEAVSEGDIYLMTLSSREPQGSPKGIVQGDAVFKIVEVIKGPKVDSITIPYRYRDPSSPPPRSGHEDTWPDLDTLGQTSVLVVLIKGPFPNAIGRQSALVAPRVMIPVSGADDPNIKAYRKMAELSQLAPDKLSEGLMDAASGTTPGPLFEYVQSAVISKLTPQQQLKVLATLLKTHDWNDRPGDLQAFEAMKKDLGRPETTDQDRSMAILAMSTPLQSKNVGIVFSTLMHLAEIVAILPNASVFLGSNDIDHLRKTIAAAETTLGRAANADTSQSISKLVAWLSK